MMKVPRLNNDRRLSKDYERTEESAVAMIHIGQIRRMLKWLEKTK